MAIIDLAQPFAIRTARKQVMESLQAHGEEAIALHMFHPVLDTGAERCPNCYDEDYKQSDMGSCSVCYGTSFNGGIKEMSRMWVCFDDAPNVEDQDKRGIWQSGERTIQMEARPVLMEHDYIFRVYRWSQDHRPLEIGEAYAVNQMTINSLRTGNQNGQNVDDIVGQRCKAHSIDTTHVIYKIKGRVISPSMPVESYSPYLLTPQQVPHYHKTPRGYGKMPYGRGPYGGRKSTTRGDH